MSIEAMKQALEALRYHTAQTRPIHQTNEAIKALEEALAIEQTEKQEPVVTVPRRLALNTWAFLAQDCSPCAHRECQIGLKNVGVDTLTEAWNKQLEGNTHPPQRTWVGLTDEEIEFIYADTGYNDIQMFARAIEAAHGIKE